MYSISDKLKFGKYEGFTIEEIFCGQRYITQRFIDAFIHYKLDDLHEDLSSSYLTKDYTFKVKNLDVLMNNELLIELFLGIDYSLKDYPAATNHAFFLLNEYLFLDDRSIETIEMFGSANQFILEVNKTNQKNFKPSADPQYIEWCILNLDSFFLDTNEILVLQEKNCYHFHGVHLLAFGGGWHGIFDNSSALLKYNPTVTVKRFQFSQNALDINNEKSLKRVHRSNAKNTSSDFGNTQSNFSSLYDPQYSDGYGGYLDQGFVDDALDGDPDNYWNID